MRIVFTIALAALVLESSISSGIAADLPDTSLAVDQYIQRGVPPLDRAWSVADYEAAERALLEHKIGELPHLSSDRSRPIVEKLTDPKILDLFSDRSVAPNIRLEALDELTASQQRLARPYAAEDGIVMNDAEDLFHFAALFLQTLVVRFDLQDELVSAHSLDGQPSAVELEQLLQRDRATLGPSIHGLCKLLLDREDDSDAGRPFFANVMAKAYPRLAYRLPTNARAELDLTLQDVARNDPSPAVRSALTDFAK